MYVKTIVTLTDLNGSEDDYEVGACVDYEPGGNGWSPTYSVSEPEFSAPGSTLKESRLATDPQAGEVFPEGWSISVEEHLVDAYEGFRQDGDDLGADADEYDDVYADREDGDYLCGED